MNITSAVTPPLMPAVSKPLTATLIIPNMSLGHVHSRFHFGRRGATIEVHLLRANWHCAWDQTIGVPEHNFSHHLCDQLMCENSPNEVARVA